MRLSSTKAIAKEASLNKIKITRFFGDSTNLYEFSTLGQWMVPRSRLLHRRIRYNTHNNMSRVFLQEYQFSFQA